MHVIRVRNVNDALWKGLWHLKNVGVRRESRNGPVLVAPEPVTTVYEKPMERVLVDEVRDANPFFHLMESLWMLAGRNDVDFVARFVGRMREFSDDGRTLSGAYGHRWRRHFQVDQVADSIRMLKDDPTTRRAVIAMYDPAKDSPKPYPQKDIPCNTHLYLDATSGVLNMTVSCRSNDVIWGAYGANAVHFSFLQEFIAACVGIPVGKLYQISNNYHIYIDRPDVKRLFNDDGTPIRTESSNPYTNGEAVPFPILTSDYSVWMRDLEAFMSTIGSADIYWDEEREREDGTRFADPWFQHVAYPMIRSWRAYKQDDPITAYEEAWKIKDGGWRIACLSWIRRRLERRGK